MTTAEKAGAGAGLWIKVAVNIASRKVTFRVLKSVVETLPGAESWPFAVKRAAAVGFLTMLWAGITEHTTDGVVEHLPDELLEDWAGWQGIGAEPGAFARWIRTEHLADDGKPRDWDDFGHALQSKRQSDAERKRMQRERERQAADEAARQAELELGARDNGAERPRVVVEDRGTVARNRAFALTIAANNGMHDNAELRGEFNPIIATRADGLDVAEHTINEGCDDGDLLARVVYSLARSYKPAKRGDSIRSLTFFKDSAPRAYHRALAMHEVGADKFSPLPDAVFTSNGKGSHASKANDTAAGAFAAAAHRGLSE